MTSPFMPSLSPSFENEVIGTELQICVECSEVLGANLTSVEDEDDEFCVGKYLVICNGKAGSQLEHLIGSQEESVMRVLSVNGKLVSDIMEYKQAMGDNNQQQCSQLALLYPGFIDCNNIDQAKCSATPFTGASIEKLHRPTSPNLLMLQPSQPSPLDTKQPVIEPKDQQREPQDLFPKVHARHADPHHSILLTGKRRCTAQRKSVTFKEEQQFPHPHDSPTQPTKPPQKVNDLKKNIQDGSFLVEEQQYSPQYSPSKDGTTQPTEAPQQVNALKKALQDGTPLDVVETLRQNSSQKLRSVQSLQKQADITKGLIFRSTGTKKQDQILKHKLLKIYINFALIVKQVEAKQMWEQLDIQFNQIEGLQFENKIEALSGQLFAMQETVKKIHEFPPLPLVFDEDTSSYLVHLDQRRYLEDYNPVLCDFDRTLMLDLDHIKFQFKISQLHKECPPDKSWKQVVIQANPRSNMPGKLKLCARRTQIDHSALDEKRNSLLKTLLSINDWINHWNQDFELFAGKMNLRALPSNIKDEDNISMLHVAVLLEDFELIAKLIREGARPDVESRIGSPESMANEIAKEMEKKQSIVKHASTGFEEARYENIKKIINLFKDHSNKDKSGVEGKEEDENFWDIGSFNYPC